MAAAPEVFYTFDMEIPGNYLGGLLAILLLSSMVKLVTALSILRVGIGLNGSGFGAAVLALAAALSVFAVSPQLEPLGGPGLLFGGKQWPEAAVVERQFRPFMKRHTAPDTLERFEKMRRRLAPDAPKDEATSPPFSTLIAAFIVSQLKEAFYVGFMFLIPFLVIDLLVANVLLAIGTSQLSVAAVSLPFKILLFFAVDGWTLVSEKLLQGYLL